MDIDRTSKTNKSDKSRQADFFDTCQRCKIDCCSGAHPPITLKRRATIQDYLNKNGIIVENSFESNTYTFPRETADNHCVFLDRDSKRCWVHLVKPETCVAGPITFDINAETGKIEWFLKMKKICPLAGVLYRNQEALNNHLKSAKRELLQLVRDLDAESLRAILKSEEPGTFKIGEDSLDKEVLSELKTSA